MSEKNIFCERMDTEVIHSVLEFEADYKRKKWLSVISLVISLVFLLFSILLSIFSISHRRFIKEQDLKNYSDLINSYINDLPYSLLPKSFIVDKKWINPATNQGSRGTCWAFATLYLLESHYRAQGVDQGFLRENEYVRFSVQAFTTLLKEFCEANRDSAVCKYGGMGLANISSEDNEIEQFPDFLKAVSNLNISIVPESVCPYNLSANPTNEFDCPLLKDYLDKNPIRFTFKNLTTVYDTGAIKHLLLQKKRALGISATLGNIRYQGRCDNSQFENLDPCTKYYVECSQYPDEKCYYVEFDARANGIFFPVDRAVKMTELGGHAMNILGYNDEYIINSRFNAPEIVRASKGAFILHNSWREDGHSIAYLMGQRTLENEQTLCPNHRNVDTWIPATLECVKMSNLKCSSDIKRVRGKSLTNGADLLKCIDSTGLVCNKSETNINYILGRVDDSEEVDAYPLENGIWNVAVIMINNSDYANANLTRIERAPMWFFSKAFTPVNVVENDPNECGYWVFPYAVVENMKRRSWDFFDNFKVSDFDLEFETSSYIRSPDSEKYNTSYLQQSTYTINYTTFDGPIPFDLIY